MKPSIFIGLPAYRFQMDADTAVSLMAVVRDLTLAGIGTVARTIDEGDIAEARNKLAARFLYENNTTHILMSDNDMVFRPSSVIEMAKANVDVIGCAAPIRDLTRAVVNLRGYEPIRDGFGTCEAIGAGLIMISRAALLRLLPTVDKKESDETFPSEMPVFGFFDRMRPLSEDLSFCKRWRDLGQPIYALRQERIGHVTRAVLRHKE